MSQQCFFFPQGWSFQVGCPIAEKHRHDCPHKKLATFDHNVMVWNMAFIFHKIYDNIATDKHLEHHLEKIKTVTAGMF